MQDEQLAKESVRLELLNETHREALYSITQDPKIWEFTATKALGDDFDQWYEKATSATDQVTFVVRRVSDGKLIGSSRFYDIKAEHRRLSIGYTWLIPEVWGSRINTECKFLMLKMAFEKIEAIRVEFMTDSRNVRSQRALKKIGAKEEGVLRNHMILPDDTYRNSIVYSIIHSEWLVVKRDLLQKLTQEENNDKK